MKFISGLNLVLSVLSPSLTKLSLLSMKYCTNLVLELVLLHDLLARLHEARTPLVQLNKEKEWKHCQHIAGIWYYIVTTYNKKAWKLGQLQFVHPIMKPEKSKSPLTENSIFRMFTSIKRLNFKTLEKDMTSPFQIRFQKLYSIDKYQHWIHPPSDELFTINVW